MNNREHRFQAYADRFLDRVVLPPFWTTGIDHASNTTDNARARARARGIKPGVPDIYVAQGAPCRTMWIELKRGSSVSDAQLSVHHSLRECGVPVSVCTTIREVLLALCVGGFRLHGNAWNIAHELAEKLAAADRGAVVPKAGASKQRKARQTAATIRRVNKFNTARFFPEHPEDVRVAERFAEPDAT